MDDRLPKSDWELLTKPMEDGRIMGELVYRRDTVWIGDAETYRELRNKARRARYDYAWHREELPEDYDELPDDGEWLE